MRNKLTILKICLILLFFGHFAYAGQNDTNTTNTEKTYTKKDFKVVAERSVEIVYQMQMALIENKDVRNAAESEALEKSFLNHSGGLWSSSVLHDMSDSEFKKTLDGHTKPLRMPIFSQHPELRFKSEQVYNDKIRREFADYYKKIKFYTLSCMHDKFGALPDDFNISARSVGDYVSGEYRKCSDKSISNATNELNAKYDKLFLSKKQSIVNSYIQKGDAVSMCYDNNIKTQEGVVFCGKAWLESKSLSDFKTKKQKASSIKGESRQGFFNEIAAVDMRNRVQNFCYKVAACVSKANTAVEEKQCYSNQMEMSNIGNSWAK